MDTIKAVVITLGAKGGVGYSLNGSAVVKYVDALHYAADGNKIFLMDGAFNSLLSGGCAPEGWTVAGITGFTTVAEVCAALHAVVDYGTLGIGAGEYTAVLSNDDDLPTPGWIRPMLLAGDIKYTTERGEVRGPYAFDLKETSLVRVKRVWLTGTTADMGIVVIY